MILNKAVMMGVVVLLVLLLWESPGAQVHFESSLEGLDKIPGVPELSPEAEKCAQYNIQIDREYEARARKELDAEGLDERGLTHRAVENLRRRGIEVFDIQRVEVTGVGSNDPVDQTFFDSRVTMSHYADIPHQAGWMVRNLTKSWAFVRDLVGAKEDRTGYVSQEVKEEFSRLANVSVNEIWAHSWGSDAVYTAILNRVITPPKRLFLLGSPSQNIRKWEAMARVTGTEVRIFGYDQDAWMRGVKNLPGEITDDLLILDETWRLWCLAHESQCNPSKRKGFASPLWRMASSDAELVKGHLRAGYYRYMTEHGWLTPLQGMLDEQKQLVQNEVQQIVNARKEDILRRDPPQPCNSIAFKPGPPVVPPPMPQPETSPVLPPIVPLPPPSPPPPAEPPCGPVVGPPSQTPQKTSCYLKGLPHGFERMEGKDWLGPYSSREECEAVNRNYFNGEAHCECH